MILDHVRVTGGNAGSGAGVANQDSTMTIRHSLIDGNGVVGRASGNDGGGILNAGVSGQARLAAHDSTITGNSVLNDGAGISSRGTAAPGNGTAVTSLDRVTVAFNTAPTSPGALAFDGLGSFTVHASIVSDNAPSNCASPLPTSLGRNVVDPIAPAHAPAPTSAATAGRRGPDATPGRSSSTSRRTRSSSGRGCTEAGSRFQCRLAGPTAFASCSSPRTLTGLPPGTYAFLVRAIDSFGAADPTPAPSTFTIAAPQREEPQPVAGDHVVIGSGGGRCS